MPPVDALTCVEKALSAGYAATVNGAIEATVDADGRCRSPRDRGPLMQTRRSV